MKTAGRLLAGTKQIQEGEIISDRTRASRGKWGRLVATGASAAALVLAVGLGLAYASIPDNSGVIHGCYTPTTGSLRVIDPSAGAACWPNERVIAWNQQGPAGPAGPAGTAVAYAHVHANGAIDSDSGNITVARVFPGMYCIGVTGETVHVAVASLDSLPNLGGTVQAGVFPATVCPSNARNILVVTRPQSQDGGLVGADRDFYIIVN